MALLDKLTKDKFEQKNIKIYGTRDMLCLTALPLYTGSLNQAFRVSLGFSTTQLGFIGTPGWIINLIMMFSSSFFADKITNRAKAVAILSVGSMATLLSEFFISIGPDFIRQSNIAFYIIMIASMISCFFSAINASIVSTLFMRAIRNNIRGRYIAICGVLGGVVGMGVSALSTYMLKALPYPYNFAVSFAIASTLVLTGSIMFLCIKELPDLKEKVIPKSVSPLANFKNVVKMKEFRILMPANILRGFGDGAGYSYAMVIGLKYLDLGVEYAGITTFIMALGGLISTGIIGFCSDRFGAGKLVPIIEVILITGLLGMVVSPAPWFFVSCYLFWYIMQNMEANAIPLIHFDVVPTEVIGAFSGVRLFFLNLIAGFSGMIAGISLDHYSPLLVFGVCAFLKLVAGAFYYNSVRIIGKKA